MSTKLALTNEYLSTLLNESNKLCEFALQLNENEAFKEKVRELTDKSVKYKNVKITAEQLISQDLVDIYNKCVAVRAENKNPKGEFTLVYYFEKLQQKKISESMSIEVGNRLVEQADFKQYVAKITAAESNDPNKFVIPSILKDIDSPVLVQYGVCMFRFAHLIIKSDGVVAKEEEILLESIFDLLGHKTTNHLHKKAQGIPENDTFELVMAELNSLIGLENVKVAINEFTNFLAVQKIREKEGLKTSTNVLHSVFMGPPGTGKTTVARLLGRIFKHLDYLQSGHVVETDRSGLVAGYVGQTAIKTAEVIDSAGDGVLFVDEAYSLMGTGLQKDFGSEAIEIILKRMEDDRGKFVVVAAGYPDEMKEFIRSNPGLQSRFNRYYTFDHYASAELLQIFELFAKNADFTLSEDAKEKLSEIFDQLYEKRDSGFGNARVVRNLFEKIIEKQANRIVSIVPITKEILMTISEEDVPEVKKTVENILMFNDNSEL